MPYIATINTPGYLPDPDDPAVFDTAQEAWEYLRDEWQEAEDDEVAARYAEDEEYEEPITIEDFTSPSRKFGELIANDRSDAMWLPRAGRTTDDAWDLGLIYSVVEIEEGD